MAMVADRSSEVADAAEAAARLLVSVRHWGDSSYVSLPLLYPSGAFVTVKLDRIATGFRVSDNGFAFRELESVGAQRSFGNTASGIADALSVNVNRRAFFVDVPEQQLARAISDVAVASWQVADRIVGRIADEEEADIEEHLRERLVEVFGSKQVIPDQKIAGASSFEWDVSALVRRDNKIAVFHAVSNYPNSIFKASTAFHDLAALDHPPALVAVVRNKAILGPKLGLLAQAGHVIEEGQPKKVFLRAAV